MPGVSSHFGHLTGRCVMGQQIVTLGVANDEQFVPVDNEIFISQCKEQALDYQFNDGRSIVAKRYQQSKQQSKQQTKPEMVCDRIARAIRAGIHAEYFLADAWFATKHLLKMTVTHSLVTIVRMKKNKISLNGRRHFPLTLRHAIVQTVRQRPLANTEQLALSKSINCSRVKFNSLRQRACPKAQ